MSHFVVATDNTIWASQSLLEAAIQHHAPPPGVPHCPGPARIGQLSATVATGCALRKGEEDPPIKPDAEYPSWLFDLLKPELSMAELERMYVSEGLTLQQMQRLFRYKNRVRIREDGEARAQK